MEQITVILNLSCWPQRLGGNKKLTSAQKWKLKKQQQKGNGAGSTDDKMQDMLKLTELANKIVDSGNMDVYQETYEMINNKVSWSMKTPLSSTQ